MANDFSIIRRFALLFSCLMLTSVLAGCSALGELKKQDDVAYTLQEADREFTLGNTAQGRQWCDRALEIDPDSLETYLGTPPNSPVQSLGLIETLREHGEYPEMVHYLTLATTNPKLSNNWRIYSLLSDAQLHVGNATGAQAADQQALTAIKKQFTTAGATIDIGNSIDLLIAKADAEWGVGDRASALKDYQNTISTYPDHSAMVENDEAYNEALSKTMLPQALRMAKDAVNDARHGDDDEVLGEYTDTLGWVEHQMGDDKDAVNDLEQASSLVPEEGDVTFHLANVYQELGRTQDAIIEFQRTLQLEPYNKDAQDALNTLTKKQPTVAAKPA
jgi:tetratricopeptide (TPR) repeat protein